MSHIKMLSPALEAQFSSFLAAAPRIVLGSSSSSRRSIMDDLAARFRFKYEVRTADIDEKAIRHAEPAKLVMALGHAKAEAIIAKMTAAGEAPGAGFLLTCDQVVVHEGNILEKPESEEEARRFIAGYARSPASTVGSVVVTNLATGERFEELDIATIHMQPVPAASVDTLVAEGEIMWCAGGLMIEHPLVEPLITGIDGTEDSVRGLSKLLVVQLLLRAAGVAVA